MATTVEQPYNLFAQQKQTGYPNAVQQRVPGQVVGETPEQFAAARQAANSQGSGYNAQSSLQQPSVQSQPSAVQTPRTVGAGRQYQDTSAPIRNTDELARAMGYTSPEEEERLRKASVANQRIMAVADAIRHIGNIANTVNGAPSMQFNNPVKDEYDRYLKGKALRDAANYKYLSYQQQKAAQDAKIRQWEAEQKYKRDKDERDFRFNAAKTAADLAEKKRQYNETAAFNKEKQKATEERWERQDADTAKHRRTMEGIAGMNARTNRERASAYINHLRSGGSGKEERRDTRRGYLTKRGATAGELKSTYHQMYEWGKKMKDPRTGKPYIDENALKGQMTYGTYSFGGSSTVSQDLKERAVDQMLMDHDDAAVRMHSKYGWEWHEQTPSGKSQQYGSLLPNFNGNSGGGRGSLLPR